MNATQLSFLTQSAGEVSDQAHNLTKAGSIPATATKEKIVLTDAKRVHMQKYMIGWGWAGVFSWDDERLITNFIHFAGQIEWLCERTGLMQNTADILQKAGVIQNDRDITSWGDTRIVGIDKRNPRAEITIFDDRMELVTV